MPTTGHCATVLTLGSLGFEGSASADTDRLLRQPKRMAVLLYMLLSQRDGWRSRDEITGIFWPESDATRARNALRQSVSFLRSCLGDEAVASVGLHGLAVRGSVACDAVRFEALLDEGRKEDALQLYRGDLLPGFHVAGSVAFSTWLDARRSHLSHRAAKAAWDLSAEREAQHDPSGAAFWGKRALALSPFSESEVQRLLRLLTRLGDFAGAIRAYRGLTSTLQDELGVAPSTETVRLVTGIMARAEATGGDLPSVPGARRFSADRRMAQRRLSQVEWTNIERRSPSDRRQGERRTGEDRRAQR